VLGLGGACSAQFPLEFRLCTVLLSNMADESRCCAQKMASMTDDVRTVIDLYLSLRQAARQEARQKMIGVKIYEYPMDQTNPRIDGLRQLWFHCPGCKNDHAFTVGGGPGPRWIWNGSFESPTFHPSLMCNRDYPTSRCHSIVTDGVINFLGDCFHEMAGKSVPMVDWEAW